MNIDYPIALMIFIIFIVWGFVFYFSILGESTDVMETVSTDVDDKIMDFLDYDVYFIPTTFETENASSNAVLYMDYFFPFGRNSVRVFSGSTALDCMLSNNTVYWQFDLVPGNNSFTVRYSDKNVTQNCTASLSLDEINQTFPLAEIKYKLISKSNMNNMTSQSYTQFKDSLGINRDFRVTLNYSGNTVAFGHEFPLNTTIYPNEHWSQIEESGIEINVTVFAW